MNTIMNTRSELLVANMLKFTCLNCSGKYKIVNIGGEDDLQCENCEALFNETKCKVCNSWMQKGDDECNQCSMLKSERVEAYLPKDQVKKLRDKYGSRWIFIVCERAWFHLENVEEFSEYETDDDDDEDEISAAADGFVGNEEVVPNLAETKAKIAEITAEKVDEIIDIHLDDLVTCTTCESSVDCRYEGIYIVNNQKEGDEFKEDTCCESCWTDLAKMYKKEGWEGDDLEDVSDDEEDDSMPSLSMLMSCSCTTKTDIRGRCDPVRSAVQFAKCPARVDTALFHILNDYQIYQELALHRDVSDKSEIIARVAGEAPYNFSGGGDGLWTGDVERIVCLFQDGYQEEIRADNF